MRRIILRPLIHGVGGVVRHDTSVVSCVLVYVSSLICIYLVTPLCEDVLPYMNVLLIHVG